MGTSGSPMRTSSDNPHAYNVHIYYKLLGVEQNILD